MNELCMVIIARDKVKNVTVSIFYCLDHNSIITENTEKADKSFFVEHEIMICCPISLRQASPEILWKMLK